MQKGLKTGRTTATSNGIQKVRGSNPLGSTSLLNTNDSWRSHDFQLLWSMTQTARVMPWKTATAYG